MHVKGIFCLLHDIDYSFATVLYNCVVQCFISTSVFILLWSGQL
jgi:hypothetical protein